MTDRMHFPPAPISASVLALAALTLCPDPVNAFATRLQLTLTGEASGDFLGTSVASAGDVNGDGYPDVIAGAFGNDAGGNQAGRAYVYFGGPDADTTPDLTLTGESALDNFGSDVAGAGDVNGDGFDDVIVGAWLNEAAGTDAGRAYVYFGGAVPDNVADLTLTAAAAGDNFGKSVAAAGDINNDGFDDFIVGAPINTGGRGSAYVYFGGASPNNTADLVLTGANPADQFGISVAAAGDFNGDRFDDIIVGAFLNDTPGSDAGRAYLYYGGSTPNSVIDLILSGVAAFDYFGSSVASAGDINADGFDDVMVGAFFNDLAGSDAGSAYIFLGGATPNNISDLTVTGAAEFDQFGYSVASAGDVNADGFDDVVVGAWFNDAFGSQSGRTYLYLGGTPLNNVPDLVLGGTAAFEWFGKTAVSAGDFNGDGFDDLIVGAEGGGSAGRAYLYDSNRYHVLSPNGGETWNVGATRTVSWLGDDLADVWLSVDGGRTYDRVLDRAGGDPSNAVSVLVPHAPTRFALIKIDPSDASLRGQDRSDSLFTILSSVDLLSFAIRAAPAGGAELSWRTEPAVGPEGLAGYRLYRLDPGAGDQGVRIGPDLITETHYTDSQAPPGRTYRLAAVNRLMEELELGRVSLAPAAPLAAWPLPYRGGLLQVSFGVAGGIARTAGLVEVELYDLAGRRVRTLARGEYPVGHERVTWDGRDAGGMRVRSGVYLLRSRTEGEQHQLKVVVLP